ncbi:MAG: methyltransferase [Gemmataceae bacterium]|nr:methyltransferase [Gemmataceae bacterium]
MASKKLPTHPQMLQLVESRLKPPFGIAMGSPREAAEIAEFLPAGDVHCWQVDLYQADRLRQELSAQGTRAEVSVLPDLWDLPAVQTLIYTSPRGSEREMKLDVVEQAFHALQPGGTFVVVSLHDNDDFFQPILKKVFGKVHVPMESNNSLFWCQRTGERPKRRHEMAFQVRSDQGSLRFTSRPGTFSYGRFDNGARALVEAAQINAGDRVLDIGCGCGANGILASRRAGADAHIAFVDSNVRALQLTEMNAKAAGLTDFRVYGTAKVEGPEERSFDVVLANPPYYANASIARLFMDRAKALLKPEGRFYMVSKQIDLIYGDLEQVFGHVEIMEHRGYLIFTNAAVGGAPTPAGEEEMPDDNFSEDDE